MVLDLVMGQFLPRDATQSAGMLQYVVCPSVRLSVRPSLLDVHVQWSHRLE